MSEERPQITEIPRNLHNITAAILNIFLSDARQIPYKDVKYKPRPSYFAQQPGQHPMVHIDRSVLRMMTHDGYISGGTASYVLGTGLNDPGYVHVELSNTP